MELDLIGLCCSVPQLTLYSALRKLGVGEEVRIRTDDRVVLERDIIPLLERFNVEYRVELEGDNYVITGIKRILPA